MSKVARHAARGESEGISTGGSGLSLSGLSLSDIARPDPRHRFGFVNAPYGRRRYWGGIHEQLLFETYLRDPEVFGFIEKVDRKGAMCDWALMPRPGFEAREEHREYLEHFFRLPDGSTPYFMLHKVILARVKVLGAAYIRLLRASVKWQGGDRLLAGLEYVVSFVKDLFPRTNTAELRRKLEEAADKPFELFRDIDLTRLEGAGIYELVKSAKMAKAPTDAIGFEVLEGQIIPNVDQRGVVRDSERSYIQVVNNGMLQQAFPERDIVAYFHSNPAGGYEGLSEVQVIEPFSDATLWSVMQQRDFLRTMGRADTVLLLMGFSETERKRLWYELLRRADPHNADVAGLPILVRADAALGRDGADVRATQIGGLPRDLLYGEFHELLFKFKMAAMNVPGGPLGRTERVNRANLDAQMRELESEVNWWNRMIAEVNSDILFPVKLNIPDWIFYIPPFDSRPTDSVIRENFTKADYGLLTLEQLALRVGEDKWTVSEMPEKVRKARFIRSGGQLMLFEAWLEQQRTLAAQYKQQRTQAAAASAQPQSGIGQLGSVGQLGSGGGTDEDWLSRLREDFGYELGGNSEEGGSREGGSEGESGGVQNEVQKTLSASLREGGEKGEKDDGDEGLFSELFKPLQEMLDELEDFVHAEASTNGGALSEGKPPNGRPPNGRPPNGKPLSGRSSAGH